MSELTENELDLILTGHIAFQTLNAAHTLGIFGHLAHRPRTTATDLSEVTGLDPLPLGILLGCLTTLRLVNHEDGHYTNAPIVTRRLVTGPGAHPRFIDFEHRIVYPAFTHLTEALRTASNVGLDTFPGPGNTLYQRLAAHPDLEKTLHAALDDISRAALPALLTAFADGRLPAQGRLLDIGSGDGTNATALARANPGLECVLFDLPTVIHRAQDSITAAGLTDRITTRPGDFFTEEFPPGSDIVLLAHLLPIFDPDQNRNLLAKARAALRAGGAVVILGPVQDDDQKGPAFAMLQSPYFLALASGQGRYYTWTTYETWAHSVGFTHFTRITDLPLGQGILIAT